MRVIGNVVGERGQLGLGTGEAPQFEILQRLIGADRLRQASRAIAPDRRAGAVGKRPVVLDQAFERLPGQVEPVEVGIAALERGDHVQRLRIVVEAVILGPQPYRLCD